MPNLYAFVSAKLALIVWLKSFFKQYFIRNQIHADIYKLVQKRT